MCGRVAQAKNPTEYGSMLKVDFTKAGTKQRRSAKAGANEGQPEREPTNLD